MHRFAKRKTQNCLSLPAARCHFSSRNGMRHLQHKLAIARGEIPAELLFKNGRLVNVLSGEIHDADIAVDDGRVVGLGDYKARQTIDLRGAYVAPSLIDG